MAASYPEEMMTSWGENWKLQNEITSAVQRSECRLRCVGWELGGGDGITVGGGGERRGDEKYGGGATLR